ncbi:MAG: nucleoside deaminase [Anaerohalosphaeraceae bacterium]|nr:nucleoside deaminase [Anaerohalosphaeraceae bacterium]
MEFELKLPEWLNRINSRAADITHNSIEERAGFVINLSHLNIEHGTGGPFGAAIFDINSGSLVSAGTNMVVPMGCSIAHAEMIAIMLAQKKLGTYRLPGPSKYQLVSSCQPCAMCMGAIPWSGVGSLVCSGREEDAKAIGFDEGDKPSDWIEKYEARNIEVIIDVLRSEACQVLRDYSKKNSQTY